MVHLWNISIAITVGKMKPLWLILAPDLLLNKPGDFCLVQCHSCDLIYQNPQLSPQELEEYYPEDYLPFQQDEQSITSLKHQILQDRGASRFCDRISRRRSEPGQLLDVGCATGHFLFGMQQRGWQVSGVEPNRHAARQANEILGLDVYHGTLTEAAYPSQFYDVVTLWDVL